MKKSLLIKSTLCLAAAGLMGFAPGAFAWGHDGGWGRGGYHGGYYHGGYYRGGHYDGGGRWIAGAIVAGAVVGGIVAATAPRPVYYGGPVVYSAPAPVVYERSAPVVVERVYDNGTTTRYVRDDGYGN